MDRIANLATRRDYHSELRAQQAEATRARILDATLRVMARGIATVSIPAVAREAGVAVSTIYHHFASKSELLAAVYPHLMRRSGVDRISMPQSVDDLREAVRGVFERMDALDDIARAAAVSPAAEEARRMTMGQRLEVGRNLAALHEPGIAVANRERIARLLVILITTASLRTWRDHLGCSVEQAADDIDWIIRAAFAAAEQEGRR